MTRTLSDSGLREYLKTVVNLEKSLYEQNILWNTLNNKLKSLGKVPQYYVSNEKPDILSLGFLAVIGAIIGWIVGAIVCSVFVISISVIFFESYDTDILTKYALIGTLFFTLICAVVPPILSYSKSTSSYKKEFREKKQMLNRAEEKANYELSVVAPVIRDELNVVARNYHNTKEVLQKLYDLDVIYSKYRNMVAVCAFYEYILSGRCTQLEGHEGAINIYESEIRLNRIICQLDDVLASLDEIKETQRELFNVISDANVRTQRLLESTVSRLDSMDKKMSEGNKLLEITQYNTSVIAQNTRVLAYYEEQIRSGRY